MKMLIIAAAASMSSIEFAHAQGVDPSQLSGMYVGDWLSDNAVDKQMSSLMGAKNLEILKRGITGVGGVFEVDGPNAVAAGCKAHACDEVFYAISVPLIGGEPVVALKDFDEKPKLWGKTSGKLPEELARVMAGKPFNDR